MAVMEVSPAVGPEASSSQFTGVLQTEKVLWLDTSEDPALSRLCLAPREIFELPVEYEDERLAHGKPRTVSMMDLCYELCR